MTKKSGVPAIRFKGFTDTWEQRKLGELVVIERGGSPRPIDDYITDSPDGLNWVKIGDAPEQGNYITSTKEKIRPEGLSKTREVHPGDLILSNSMSFGKPYIMAIDGCIHDGWLSIKNTNNVFDLKFLCVLLGTDQMLTQYKSMAAGSTVNNLNKELVGNTTVTYPSVEEQRTIGQFFEEIENLITLHQRKLEKLHNLKKAMLAKMFPQNGSVYPEIRFAGFTDAWEQRGFSSVFEMLQNNTLSRADLSEESGLAQNIHYGDVLIKYGEVLDVENEPLAYINSDKIVTAMKNSYLQNGDVIIADTAEDTTVGKCSEIANLGDKTVLSGLHTIPVRPKEEYASGYLGYYLNSNSYHDTLIPLMQGTKVTSISKSALQGTSISYPKSIDEQAKISAYFLNLDHLITLHQRKLEKLQNIKKSMLEKMFV